VTIDDAVIKWFTIVKKSKISLSGLIVKEQALDGLLQVTNGLRTLKKDIQ
jgi:hypothetical protein